MQIHFTSDLGHLEVMICMPVGCFGTSGTGKSTWVGLLAQQMNRKALREPKEFSYYISKDVAQDLLTEIKTEMLKGNFPDKTTEEDLVVLSFLMGFNPSSLERIKEALKRSFDEKRREPGNYNNVLDYNKGFILSVVDVAGEDIRKIGDPLNEYDVDRINRLKKLFSSNCIVMIVDVSRFTNETGNEGAEPKLYENLEYDDIMTKIFSRYIEFRANHDLSDKKVHPVVFLTKMDELDNEILSIHGLDDIFSDKERLWNHPYKESETQQIGNHLLNSYMPNFREILYSGEHLDVPIGYPTFFFSGLFIEGQGGKEVGQKKIARARKRDSVGKFLTNIYPHRHYEAFLDYIKEMNREYADSRDLMEQYLKQAERGEVDVEVD